MVLSQVEFLVDVGRERVLRIQLLDYLLREAPVETLPHVDLDEFLALTLGVRIQLTGLRREVGLDGVSFRRHFRVRVAGRRQSTREDRAGPRDQDDSLGDARGDQTLDDARRGDGAIHGVHHQAPHLAAIERVLGGE